jgi:hypothetical protein
VGAVPPGYAPPPRAPRPPRPWLRTALRWGIASAICVAVALVGTVALQVPARTDLPGLKTPADGRYTFPPLALPDPPPGTAAPDRAADPRQLLLPLPAGAVPVRGFLPDASGWYPAHTYSAQFEGAADLQGIFDEYGLRHIAARAWTTPDGVRTEVYLLGFRSSAGASAAYLSNMSGSHPLRQSVFSMDSTPAFPGVQSSTQQSVLSQDPVQGRQSVQVALLQTGDVEAVVIMSSTRAVPTVDFRQVVGLQGELLQGEAPQGAPAPY